MDVAASPALGLSRELALAAFPTLNPMRARYGGLSSFLARMTVLVWRPTSRDTARRCSRRT
jgi:hypothetical protein